MMAHTLEAAEGIESCAAPLASLAMNAVPSPRAVAMIAAVCFGPLVCLFVASLAIEDHRHFLSCRLNGASVDACILQIQGR
jgi:hypothetical protein